MAGSPFTVGTTKTLAGGDATCPTGFACQAIEIACGTPLAPMRGTVATAKPSTATRGMVVFFRGGGGTEWVFETGSETMELATDLLANRFTLVQIRWQTSWLIAPPGLDAGPGHLACRPATAIKWVHDTKFVPLGVPATATGVCGFCIAGNSGGATQVGYALSHYKLEAIVDAAVPSGGPPHSALAKACGTDPAQSAYWYPDDTRRFIDQGFGFGSGGPCFRRDLSFSSRWVQESVSSGGNDYTHPTTRVHFILGQADVPQQTQARDYYDRLRAEGTTRLSWQVLPRVGHSVYDEPTGRDAVLAALLAA